jgi:hypothetical protein
MFLLKRDMYGAQVYYSAGAGGGEAPSADDGRLRISKYKAYC